MTRLLILLVTISMVGCAHPLERLAEAYIPDRVIQQKKSNIVLGGGINLPVNADGAVDISKLDMAKLDADPNKASIRNALISHVLSMSDDRCTMHKALIMSNANAWNIGTGSISILLAGASSVISHARTAAELAAGAAGVTGIQALANKEVYANAMATTVLRSIDVGREKTRAPLISGMSRADYSIAQAIIDLQTYHNSCSLMAGLVEISKSLENRPLSQSEIDSLILNTKANIDSLDHANLDGAEKAASRKELTRILGEQYKLRAIAPK
ncbi:hypothetical protein [Chitinivorax sp. B]|uniref:hypothetical protein n=1 Tax=Chitinivorax sp. B TaxID=2502235 RepID=UPI0010F5B459|nr:hypothetical protein [Chitinivorax sp. B]